MADNTFSAFIVQKLQSIEEDLRDQAEVRGRILQKLEHFEQMHRKDHDDITQEIGRLKVQLNNMTMSEIRVQAQELSTKKAIGIILATLTTVASAFAWLWDKFPLLFGWIIRLTGGK